MNILHLHENIIIKGGSEVHIKLLLELLPEYGFQNYWVSINKNENGYIVNNYLTKDYSEYNSVYTTIQALKYFCSKHQIDIIHIHGLSIPLIVKACFTIAPVIRSMHEPRMICPGHGKFFLNQESICCSPFGMHCLADAYTKKCAPRNPKRLLHAYKNSKFEINYAASRYFQIIVMSNYMLNEAKLAGIPEQKLNLIPYFVESFSESTEIEHHTQEIRILYSGRFAPQKGVHLLVETLAPLLSFFPHLYLDLVGDGYFYNTINLLVQKYGIEDKVKFHGWQDTNSIKNLYKKSSIVTFPSIYPEAFGIVGIEAMAHGKPVIGFKVGGVTDWLEDGVNGFAVKSHDVIEFRNKLKYLITNNKMRYIMGKNGKNIALNKFSSNKVLPLLVEVYKNSLT